MRITSLQVTTLIIVLGIILTACSGTASIPVEETSSRTGTIQIAGSTTLQPLAEALGEAFSAKYPDIRIDVQGGGSGEGVTSTASGKVDIGTASRDIRKDEFEAFPELVVHTIAFDAIAIVTHPEIRLDSLTREEIKRIFSGQITSFSEVGGPDLPITVVSQKDGSTARSTFDRLIMSPGDQGILTDNALVEQSEDLVRAKVTSTPGAIGYLSLRFVDTKTRPVAIDGEAPSIENVQMGSYSLYRPLSMLTYGKPAGMIKEFLDWVKSEEGQRIVAKDYISILWLFDPHPTTAAPSN